MASPTKTAQNVWQTNGGEDFLQLKSSTGTVEAGIDSTGAPFGNLSPAPIPSGQVLSSDISISAAQIATWSSVPIQLLPAPGVGKFIDVLGVTLSYKHNTVDPSNLGGSYDIEIAALAGQIPSNAYATGSSNGLAVSPNTFPPYPNAQNNFQKLTVPPGPGNTYAPNVSYESVSANNLPLVLLGNQDADGTGGIGTNSLNAGGLLYAAGDSFIVSGAGANAYGYVDTVNGVTGAVLTYHLVNVGYGFTAPLTAVATTALTGSITAASVTSGNAGTNYAVGDLFQIESGDTLAYCQVASVDGSGAVLSFNLIWGGSTYSTGGGNSTSVLSGFGDGNLQVDIGSVQDSNGDNNFTIDIASLFLPDGTIKISITYTINDL